MEPRGRIKQLVDAMKAQPEKALWYPPDVREAMGIATDTSIAAFLSGGLKQQWFFKHEFEGRRVAYSLEPQEEEATPFHCTLHVDGDLDLFGLSELENGGLRMDAEQVAQLKRLLCGRLEAHE